MLIHLLVETRDHDDVSRLRYRANNCNKTTLECQAPGPVTVPVGAVRNKVLLCEHQGFEFAPGLCREWQPRADEKVKKRAGGAIWTP
jgi:hypothetical protein